MFNSDQAYRQLRSIKQKAEALGASRDPAINNYLTMLERDPGSWALAKALEMMLDEYEVANAHTPNHLAPPPMIDDLYGAHHLPDATIGQTTETNVRYGPRIIDNCGSIAVAGITGGGKTTAIINTILALLQLNRISTLIFDVKGDFNCIASVPEPHVRVHRVREELPLRLVRPPTGVPLDSWLARLATYICEYRGLKKSRHLLLDRLTRLCVHFGVTQDPTGPWPSLLNVLDYLSSMKGAQFGKDAEYKASLVNELRGLLEDSGRVFDTSDGIDVDEHLLKQGGITVLRMETLPAPAQQVVISLIVDRVIAARACRNVHNVALDVLVVIDEAQQVLSQKADFESSNGVAPLAMQLLRGRESGVGFIVAPHLLQDISHAVLSAAKTMFVVGGLGDATSIDIAARMMNLPYEARTMIPRLGRGQALVREIGIGNYTDAFLVNLDPPLIAKDAIDEPSRVRLMTPKLAGLPMSLSKPLTDYPSIMAELNVPWSSGKTASKAGSSSPSPAQPELDLLHDCARHWSDPMKDRSARLKIRDYKVLLRLAKSLAAQQLLVLHDVRLGRTTYSFLEVSDLGWQTLGQARPPRYIGHGGFVHTVLISRVTALLMSKKWANVQAEFPVGSDRHPVDVFAISPKRVGTAFEITLSQSNVVSNATKSLAGTTVVQELIFLCPVQDDCDKVESMLQKASATRPLLSKIQVRRVDQYIV